jgi:hypothetical protein
MVLERLLMGGFVNTNNGENNYESWTCGGGREGAGEFVIVWYWGFWGSIIKIRYTFAMVLCSIDGLGVH